uniref:Uncharacterized protein n=1 Tax=Anguilla anguilla TaxID=7936 RepID=A0A0E9RN03_ANGAN
MHASPSCNSHSIQKFVNHLLIIHFIEMSNHYLQNMLFSA